MPRRTNNLEIVTLFVSALLVAWPAHGAPAELDDAADHHVGLQGRYANGLADSWEWKLGSGRSAENLTGISAIGLVAAHRITKQKAHLDSAQRAARALLGAFDRGFRQRRPFTQDIEFLVAAGYIIDAYRWFGRIVGRHSAASFAEQVLARRAASGAGSLAGWDLASAIRAAVAVGRTDYARGLLSHAVEHRLRWDRADRGRAQLLARASLLWSLARLRDVVGLSSSEAQLAGELQRALIKAQRPNGAWLTDDGQHFSTQLTAYATIGLSAWSKRLSKAAEGGRRWLERVGSEDQKLIAGGRIWSAHYNLKERPEGDFYGAVQSEVLLALSSNSSSSH
ncbi:MAG: hypothetical protein H6707_15480 [Deltaproteobacteria bacterium]|nr:hypothetical protein [Deltaproteobacteria bacterium]